MNLLIKWLISATAIVISAYLIPGVFVAGFWTAIWLSVLLGIINVVLKPILIILTLPINIITLGLFTFVINAALILFASSLVKGFSVDGFFAAMLFSMVLSVVGYFLNSVFVKK